MPLQLIKVLSFFFFFFNLGTVFDDINNSGCIPQQECSCTYNGKTYATGTSFSEPCQTW